MRALDYGRFLAGCFVPGFWFLAFVFGRFVPGSSFLALRVLGVLGALGALDGLGSRRPLPTASPHSWLVASYGWLGVLRVFRGRIRAGG